MNSTFKSALTDKTDVSDIGVTSMNTFESTYNIVICYLLMKNEKECKLYLTLLKQQLYHKYKNQYAALVA